MNATTSPSRDTGIALKIILGTGTAIGLWVATAMTFALARADWQVSELARQYLVSIGLIQDFETMVDFYTHIKGVEYIICLAFLGSFPAYFKYLNRSKEVTVK
ncbi:MAG: hypothetical protein HGA96_17750 [Desulfobulbaceae bacterium]|nr:hypothetical protein [Desulfobulbaceae bacterium]